ncbi:MAG: anthranilate phosphoribosyltransferase [Thermomicrobiales bacterium]
MPDDNVMYDIRDAIRSVVEGRELSDFEATSAMTAIMDGEATGAQIAALVTGLRLKGETVPEIAGFARAMRAHAVPVVIEDEGAPLLDTCGTGGDYANTFNISTTATFAIAAAGVRIAKHGNRAASSMCGSADLLEGLGIQVELTSDQVAESVQRVGVGFMFAPAFHPAMRFVGPTRREIGIRTIFNVLGPLTNPAGASHQLIGVGHPEIAPKLANVLRTLGSSHAVLVHADEGLDEVGIEGPTYVTEWDAREGEIREYTIAPEDFGFERARREDILGGSVDDNVRITQAILAGETGPRRTITIMNAGAGIYAADAAESIAEGIAMAISAIDSGAALAKMEEMIAITRALTTGAPA